MNKFLVSHPIISEKATRMSAERKYVFKVKPDATAPEVKKVIEAHYKVSVEAVHMITVKPKERRLGRSIGVKSGYKKAIVTVKEGQKLDVLPH